MLEKLSHILITIFLLAICACQQRTEISTEVLKIEYNNRLHSQVTSFLPGSGKLMNGFQASEYIILKSDTIKNFNLTYFDLERIEGKGKKAQIKGIYNKDGSKIEKHVTVQVEGGFPQIATVKVVYTNLGDNALDVKGWVNNHYVLLPDSTTKTIFWSYQSGSYAERPDWVLPVEEGFYQENYMGMNATDYGGGTPVVDVWRKDAGIAVGHVEEVPKLVSLPLSFKVRKKGAELRVVFNKVQTLSPQEKLETITTFAAVHRGDYFSTLREYSRYMQEKKKVKFIPFPETAYQPVWCAWGYERDFETGEVLATLPKAKELGFQWAVLDDGWQTAEGDWYLNPKKFPGGTKDMRAFVDKIHNQGLKAKLWWAPLAVDPGTDLYNKHPELLLINKDGKPQDISWWDSYYLCPAYQPTLTYTKKLVKQFLQDWGFDGLKIDGQHLNAAPPCYNPAHNHAYPQESVEKLPEFFKMIYETALSIKSDAVVEICPCGTACSYYNMPYMNQPVSSDPTSSWQVRLKGKTFKALMGPSTPYYGDHVELSDNGNDFASTVGIGGLPGSKFTWQTDRHEHKNYLLTKKKDKEWKKWLDIYQENMLPKGKYLGGLYDIGFDRPETHVIKKGDTLYYAFYADSFDGKIELRGMRSGVYQVVDYVNKKKLTEVSAGNPQIAVSFEKHLLIRCTKIEHR